MLSALCVLPSALCLMRLNSVMNSESTSDISEQARMNLVELGGRVAQDLGLGRIAGQVLVYLYLSPEEQPLDAMQQELGLSKAAASIAARQLESMGLLKQVWKPGDRKNYYRTADNLASVFRDGMVSMLSRKIDQANAELTAAAETLKSEGGDEFLLGRVSRASDLSGRAKRILNSRIVRYLVR